MHYATPQDAEDAYYDAIEAGDAAAMMAVWEASEEIFCLLPMTPPTSGAAVARLWQSILRPGAGFAIEVRHLRWIESGDLAIHLIEERTASQPDGQTPPAIHATNLFRRGPDGWRLLLHQNSPLPPTAPGMPSSSRSQTLMA